MMLNKAGVYLFTTRCHRSQARKLVFTRLGDLKRAGEEVKLSMLVFTRLSGLKRTGEEVKLSKLVFTRISGLKRAGEEVKLASLPENGVGNVVKLVSL